MGGSDHPRREPSRQARPRQPRPRPAGDRAGLLRSRPRLCPDLYGEDFVDHVNDMTFEGLAGVRESVGMYPAIFSDLGFDVDDRVSETDRVASRWTLRGTYRGRPVALRGITISRFADGRIVEDWGARTPSASYASSDSCARPLSGSPGSPEA